MHSLSDECLTLNKVRNKEQQIPGALLRMRLDKWQHNIPEPAVLELTERSCQWLKVLGCKKKNLKKLWRV